MNEASALVWLCRPVWRRVKN